MAQSQRCTCRYPMKSTSDTWMLSDTITCGWRSYSFNYQITIAKAILDSSDNIHHSDCGYYWMWATSPPPHKERQSKIKYAAIWGRKMHWLWFANVTVMYFWYDALVFYFQNSLINMPSLFICNCLSGSFVWRPINR